MIVHTIFRWSGVGKVGRGWKKLRRTFSNRVRTTDIPRSPRHPPIGRLSPGPGVRIRRIRGYEARGWVWRCSEISLTPRPARDQDRGHLLYCQRLYLHSAFQWLDLSSFGLFSIDDRAMKIWGRSWTDVTQWCILNGWYLQNICILSRAMDHFVMSSPRPSTDRTIFWQTQVRS